MCSIEGDGFAALEAAVERLAAEPVAGDAPQAAEALAGELETLHAGITRLQAQFVRRLAAFDAAGGAEQLAEASAGSTQAWLRRRLRESPGSAAAHVTAARRLGDLPAVAAAFAAGEIGMGHVRVITRVATDWRLDMVQQVEELLVDVARRLHPAQLGRCAARIRIAADPEPDADRLARRYRQRRLSFSIFDGMLLLEGAVPMAAGGEEIVTALDALERPDPAGTPEAQRRGRQQRLADALVDLAAGALRDRTTPIVGGERPHVSMIATVDALAGLPGAAAAQLAWGGEVGSETARRLACDARLTQVLVGRDGRPRGVDHSRRTVPHWLRQAVIARDGSCRGPDCDRPPGWCEVHHIHFWTDGGLHELPNLLLLCRRCHMLVHEGRWTVTLHPDAGCTWTDPRGHTVTTTPDPFGDHVDRALALLAERAPP